MGGSIRFFLDAAQLQSAYQSAAILRSQREIVWDEIQRLEYSFKIKAMEPEHVEKNRENLQVLILGMGNWVWFSAAVYVVLYDLLAFVIALCGDLPSKPRVIDGRIVLHA